MRCTLILSACLAFLALPASAQIEMNSAGAVGIGLSPSSTAFVTIEAPSGNNQYDALHVIGHATYLNYGIRTEAHNGGVQSFGIYASASSIGSGPEAYAVYGTAPSGDFAGYFNGDVTVTGTFSNPSDRQFKRDISLLSNQGTLDSVMRLRPSSFHFRQDREGMHLPQGRQFGLIAQEVQTVFPELVSQHQHPISLDKEEGIDRGPLTYESINYIQLIPILIQAIQEQQQKIEQLYYQISNLDSSQ